ncbi:hypothetical protein [Kitasatospora sp. GP82]|nr:hypothetical protein [Kitasatospora sp. GP82]MDH6129739.1 hypothetical protein [Kitasatospora sp. GP82]
MYHHVSREPKYGNSPQQQAAEAWDALEKSGYEAIEIDGVRLDGEEAADH